MEPVYTREQLEKAWFKYCQNVKENRSDFNESFSENEEDAKECVNYLLSLVE